MASSRTHRKIFPNFAVYSTINKDRDFDTPYPIMVSYFIKFVYNLIIHNTLPPYYIHLLLAAYHFSVNSLPSTAAINGFFRGICINCGCSKITKLSGYFSPYLLRHNDITNTEINAKGGSSIFYMGNH